MLLRRRVYTMLTNTTDRIHFSVQTFPKPKESGKGYLFRLATYNGRFKLSELAEAIDYSHKTSSFCEEGADFENFLNAIAKHIGSHELDLPSSFASHPLAIDEQRAVKRLRTSFPKVCPECMKEDNSKYLKSDWQYAHVTHCEKHKTELLHVCPDCGEELNWTGDIFEGCSCCGFRWSDHESALDEVPIYQSVCAYLTDIELKEYLRALYQAFVYVCRPFDLTFGKFTELPSGIVNISGLFTQAYQLISNPQFASQWFSQRSAKLARAEGFEAFSETTVSYLANLPKVTELSFLPKAPIDSTAVLEQSMLVSRLRQNISGDKISDFRDHIDLSAASQILGVTKKTINAFVENGLLESFNGGVKSTNRIVSARSISKLISKINKHSKVVENPEIDCELVSIKRLSKCLPYFNCELPSLLLRLKNNNSQVYLTHSESFSIWDLYVNRSEAIACLESFFVESIPYQTSSAKLKDVCNLSTSQYKVLSEEFDFQDHRVCPSFATVNSSQVGEFFKKYVLINRWCKISGVKLNKVIKFLNCEAGLKKYPDLDEHDIYVFEQSKELTNSLTRFLLYHKGEYQLLAQLCP